MAKKIFVFMAIVCVGLFAFLGWSRFEADRTGPEINFSNQDFVYKDGMTDSELLQGVTAFDEKDGNVSDSLAVESVYAVDDTEVYITYVAKDKSNNISKLKQLVSYEKTSEEVTGGEEQDADTPVDEGADAEDVPNEEGADFTDAENADITEGTENTDAAEPEGTADGKAPSDVSAEAEQARAEQEAAAAQMPSQCPRIYLTDYVVTIPVGTSVDRLSYVKEITDDADNVYDLWTKIQISGTLDVFTAGTYECTYLVVDSAGNVSNQAVLKFIVQ